MMEGQFDGLAEPDYVYRKADFVRPEIPRPKWIRQRMNETSILSRILAEVEKKYKIKIAIPDKLGIA